MTTEKKKRPGDHVVMGDQSFRCLNCGQEQRIDVTGGLLLDVFAAMGKAFEKVHKKCKPSPAGARRMNATTPDEWMDSWDTGVSSKTIWSVMTGRRVHGGGGGPFRPCVPLDPSDFGRCHRLLQKFPGWRERLGLVAKAHPAWVPLVREWAECERLYDEELPTGNAPKLYDLMKKLIAEGEKPAKESSS